MTESNGFIIFVESSRPPNPVSMMAIHFFVSEMFKSHRHCDLKKRWLNWLPSFTIFFNKTNHLLLTHHGTIDFNPFTEINIMRRGIKAYFFSCSLENRSKHMRSTPLTVGARNMNAWKTQLRLIQHCAQQPDIGEVFFNGGIPYPLKHRQGSKQHFNRLFIIHDVSWLMRRQRIKLLFTFVSNLFNMKFSWYVILCSFVLLSCNNTKQKTDGVISEK